MSRATLIDGIFVKEEVEFVQETLDRINQIEHESKIKENLRVFRLFRDDMLTKYDI